MTSLSEVRAARGRGQNTRRLIYDALRQRIVTLDLAPGQALSEAELALLYGVSRTPIRESLILLAEEGLVDIYPQRGTYVGRIHLDDVLDAQFVREALECAALASANPAGAPVADLRRVIATQHAAADAGDGDEFFRLDERFHSRLMEISGHGAAWRLVGQAKAQLDRARRLSLPLEHKLDELTRQHEAVVDRLAAGDVEAAVEALRRHLRLVLGDITTVRDRNPALFDDAEDGAPPVG